MRQWDAGGGATGNFPQNAYNMAADYGPLAFDIPHRFVASAIYELPFGANKPLADASTPEGRAQNTRVELHNAALRNLPIGGAPPDGGGQPSAADLCR